MLEQHSSMLDLAQHGRLLGAVVSDEPLMRSIFPYLLSSRLDARIAHTASTNEEALSFLGDLASRNAHLDFLLADLRYRDDDGVQDNAQLVKRVRSLAPCTTYSGGLRLRHLPIIVFSDRPSGAHDKLSQTLRKLDRRIVLVGENAFKRLSQAIVDAICDYRDRILADLQRVGLSIYWRDGAYRVAAAYQLPSYVESEYIAGGPERIARGYGRLILVNGHWSSVQTTARLFEQMINDSSLDERDFQAFFRRHPEFLLGDQYDSYWAEPRLTSPATGRRIAPDFVLQPAGNRAHGWNWSVVDLKRHDVPLITRRRTHRDLPALVHRVATQLRNYRDFFLDPRNEEMLQRRFGGVRPAPRLCAIVGRLPAKADEREAYSTLVSRLPEVKVVSYDEVLEFRQATVSRMQALRFTSNRT